MTVFAPLVGQGRAVAILKAAVAAADDGTPGGGAAMTHAWLFTGPPGSGRSTSARAFAAALLCPEGGCDDCHECHTALIGTHPDVNLVTTELLSISVDVARELVLEAAVAPSVARWRVIVIEDADRLTEQANNALLKSIEDPTPHTVWLLCAPSQDDVLPTLRSRTRHIGLVTPSTRDVADYLAETEDVDPAMASFAARASQGHIGRARALANYEEVRLARAEMLRIPSRTGTLGNALTAARDVIDAATERAEVRTRDHDARERVELARGLGVENPQRVPKWAAPQFKELKKAQEKRAKRALRDELDRDLLDLMTYYRDVLVVQSASRVELVNSEMTPDIERLARAGQPEGTLRSMEAIAKARERVDASVAPLLAVEELMLALKAD